MNSGDHDVLTARDRQQIRHLVRFQRTDETIRAGFHSHLAGLEMVPPAVENRKVGAILRLRLEFGVVGSGITKGISFIMLSMPASFKW
jgi:hypothetical protein